MPTARATGHRLRAGTYTAAQLTSTYNVVDFAVQSDQNALTPWVIDAAGTTPPKYARIVSNADLSRSADGFVSWQWRFSYKTNGMVGYWLTTFLPAGVQSAAVTALTYDETDTVTYWNATLLRTEFPSSDAQYMAGGWGSVIWRFVKGTQIFP